MIRLPLQPVFRLEALEGELNFIESGASFSTAQTVSLSCFRVLSSDAKRCPSAGDCTVLLVWGTGHLYQAVEATHSSWGRVSKFSLAAFVWSPAQGKISCFLSLRADSASSESSDSLKCDLVTPHFSVGALLLEGCQNSAGNDVTHPTLVTQPRL